MENQDTNTKILEEVYQNQRDISSVEWKIRNLEWENTERNQELRNEIMELKNLVRRQRRTQQRSASLIYSAIKGVFWGLVFGAILITILA